MGASSLSPACDPAPVRESGSEVLYRGPGRPEPRSQRVPSASTGPITLSAWAVGTAVRLAGLQPENAARSVFVLATYHAPAISVTGPTAEALPRRKSLPTSSAEAPCLGSPSRRNDQGAGRTPQFPPPLGPLPCGEGPSSILWPRKLQQLTYSVEPQLPRL